MTKPRLTEIFGITVEADLNGRMLYIVNEDKPGFIGRLGGALGEAGVNIGTFHLGRRENYSAGQAPGRAEAVLLLSVDDVIPDPLLASICRLPGVKTVKGLAFA
jgi:D-3-phosphoglycerate dehydrogenase